jgi:hypothetical protein
MSIWSSAHSEQRSPTADLAQPQSWVAAYSWWCIGGRLHAPAGQQAAANALKGVCTSRQPPSMQARLTDALHHQAKATRGSRHLLWVQPAVDHHVSTMQALQQSSGYAAAPSVMAAAAHALHVTWLPCQEWRAAGRRIGCAWHPALRCGRRRLPSSWCDRSLTMQTHWPQLPRGAPQPKPDS